MAYRGTAEQRRAAIQQGLNAAEQKKCSHAEPKTNLPPIPEAAYEAAHAPATYANVIMSAVQAAHPHIVIATLRWAAKEYDDRIMDLLADEIEAGLSNG
jgi:hypothetical protein